jgi:hypothetical protein
MVAQDMNLVAIISTTRFLVTAHRRYEETNNNDETTKLLMLPVYDDILGLADTVAPIDCNRTYECQWILVGERADVYTTQNCA